MIICVPTGALHIRSDAPKAGKSIHVPLMYINNVHELLLDRGLVVDLARGPPKAA